MEARGQKPDSLNKPDLKKAIEELKNSEPSQSQIDASAARVWARVSAAETEASGSESTFGAEPETLRNCDDYQSLIPRYLDGELGRARVLLLEDHSSECLDCRHAISSARHADLVTMTPRRNNAAGGVGNWKWAGAGIAAVLLVGFVTGGGGLLRQMLFPIEIHASAQTVRGRLFRVGGTDLETLLPGERIGARESVRTARDSGAILELSDGTRIEMRERSELTLVPASDGIRVLLERGSVIVEAASQGSGHLYVSTDDVDVSVVGTIFAVSEGTKGARVSVIEGEVLVAQGSTATALFPGEQFNSASALTAVPIEEEISWSQDREQHLAVMLELAKITGDLQSVVVSPEVRYSSTLLDLAPADTLVYVAFPNVARTISDSYDVLSTRILANPVTAQWWEQMQQNAVDAPEFSAQSLETVMGYLRSFSSQIGDEVVVALADGTGEPDFVILTEVQSPQLVIDLLRGIAALSDSSEGPLVVTSAEEIAASDPTHRAMAYVGPNGLLALGTSDSVILDVIQAQQAGSAFQTTGFYQSLAAIYADGTDWLFAADLDTIVSHTDGDEAEFRFLGLDNVDDLFVDFRSVGDQLSARASMTFSQARTGVASWLAEPGPMGSLEFVSPDALGVAAGLTRDVGSILGEVFVSLQEMDPEAWNEIVAFQQEHRFDIQYDLASAFGGEFVLALDGPILPTPSWKVIVEVYNAATLQNAVERLVFEFNRVALTEGRSQIEIAAETSGGRIYHVLGLAESNFEVHYTYYGGYLIAAPSRALVIGSVQNYEARSTLGNSAAFRALLPAGGQNYCSAVVYQNIEPLTSVLSGFLPESGDALESAELAIIEELIGNTSAMFGCVIAEDNRIIALNEGSDAFGLLALGGFSALMDAFPEIQP